MRRDTVTVGEVKAAAANTKRDTASCGHETVSLLTISYDLRLLLVRLQIICTALLISVSAHNALLQRLLIL